MSACNHKVSRTVKAKSLAVILRCILGAGKENKKSKTDKKVASKRHRREQETQGLTFFFPMNSAVCSNQSIAWLPEI